MNFAGDGGEPERISGAAISADTFAMRTREIGIRVAIGATRADVLRLVVGQGGRQILIGLGIGLMLAVVLSRAFAAAVEQLPPADGPLLLSIVAAITLTALAAVAAPAWRATRLRVLDGLRH